MNRERRLNLGLRFFLASDDPAEQEAIALRHVRVVGEKWIVKTSSGKTARSANKEKFLRELGKQAVIQ
ncbi:MAG: hypothetical protein HY864_16005 [Chloroflexi bacterium]|nr:hypothetical protein [Chloroflexota bacterium]